MTTGKFNTDTFNKYKLNPLLIAILLLLLLALLLWIAANFASRSAPPPTPPAAPQAQAPAARQFWIDLNMQPALVEWFNHAAQPGDMARADQLGQIGDLDEVRVGRKVVVFKSAALAEQLVPRIADKMQILGYNLEHGPFNPLDEQADPLGSVQRMRALADHYGMELALGPDHDFALSHGVALAPYVDIFVMQVQRVQEQPEVVRDFVAPLAEELRQANPTIQTAMQIRTEGDVVALAELVESLAGSLDGVSILTSGESTETAQALVAALRPSLAAAQATTIESPVAEREGAEGVPWYLIWAFVVLGIMAGMIGGAVIGVSALLVWQKAKV
jgi:hypothetical protein